MRATCLLGVLLVAKTTALAGQDGPWSFWWPFVYLWQDVLVALAFFLLDGSIKRPALAWILYCLVVAYTAINVPIGRVLSTPLTWPLVRAAGGPLADSIAHYLTAANLVSLALPVVAGVLLPWWLSRRRTQPGRRTVAAAILFAVIGWQVTPRVDTGGRHRNALVALGATSVGRLGPVAADADWRTSPFGGPAGDDLTALRGSMEGRHVVLVILESTAARYLGLYGARRDPTPALTALARHALVFDRAYAVYPESVKGLFATLCSRYPAFDTEPEAYAGVPCASLAGRLKEAGYRTALFHSGRFGYLGMRSMIERRGFDLLEDAGAIGGQVHSSFGVDEPSTVRRVLRWIDSLDGRERFFVVYQPIAGHHPYASMRPGSPDAPPRRDASREDDSDFGRYLDALGEGDAALGDLVAGLVARNLHDETVFVVHGDHGEAFGQHPGNFAHTLFIYDENIRVPFLIAAPGLTRDRRRVARLASVVDTAPTILDLLGIPPPAAYQGVSLLEPGSRMALFCTDYSLGWLGLADGCWKYMYEMDSRRSRLFDVCRDPDETRDLADDHKERAEAYRERVERWAAAQKDAIARRR